MVVGVVLLAACGDDGGGVTPDAALVCTTDEQCDDGVFCNGAERCAPGDALANALGCVAAGDPCASIGACIETMAECDTSCAMPDGDADGVDRIECGGDDCDDTDANRYPGNAEVCDDEGHDEDCDASTVGGLDRDRDGFVDARCFNEGGAQGDDCNDLEATVSPLSGEVCNGRDDDCDGDVDEGVALAGFVDADADGRGDDAFAMTACAGAARFAVLGSDCDDGDLSVQPVQNEICDAKDNDCDGSIDENARPALWYEDVDGDGYGDVRGARLVQCDPPPGYSLLPTDCAPGDASRSPVGVEICNGLDDDCNGVADFAATPGDLEDDDHDGIPDVSCGGGDCDDLDPFVGPGLPEYCNGRDDDCDGMVDEDLTESDFYADRDGDGYGAGPAMALCGLVPGLVPRAGDCNDLDPGTTVDAIERCDNVDNDCDGSIDEGAASTCSGDHAIYACVDGFCEIAQCTGTFGDCDFRASTGCETDLAMAANHCGLCGASCGGAGPCDAGTCASGDPITVSAMGNLYDTGGALLTWMPVYAPLTGPTRSTTTDASGAFSLDVPGLTPVVAGGGGCFPTLYELRSFALGPYSEPPMFFQGFSGTDLVPLETDEVVLLAMEAASLVPGAPATQLPDRGIVFVLADNFVPDVPGAATINLTDAPALGLTGARPIAMETFTGDNRLGAIVGAGEVTSALVFMNVPPGPLEIAVEGCTVAYSPGIVLPGTATLVSMSCLSISAG